MGELADAIREHLELKRRRGADPAEVAREEQEALAPVTRSHPVVVAPPPIEYRSDVPGDVAVNASGLVRERRGPWNDHDDHGVEGDSATQEFLVDHARDWLEDEA